MKKFYDDEMLGIQQEDAPTNSVAGGGVSLPVDAVKKRKRKNYMMVAPEKQKHLLKEWVSYEQREKPNFRKSVKENMDNFGNEYLFEANVDILRKIVKNKQNMPVKMKDGKMKVDLYTASALTQL